VKPESGVDINQKLSLRLKQGNFQKCRKAWGGSI